MKGNSESHIICKQVGNKVNKNRKKHSLKINNYVFIYFYLFIKISNVH